MTARVVLLLRRVDSDETMSVDSGSTGSLRDFIVADSEVESRNPLRKTDKYLEVIDFVVLALSDLRIALLEDSEEATLTKSVEESIRHRKGS